MLDVYGQEGCFYCKLAIDFLESKGIDHQYINVTHDAEAMRMFRENNFRSVPQIFLDNEHLGGYNELREYYKDR